MDYEMDNDFFRGNRLDFMLVRDNRLGVGWVHCDHKKIFQLGFESAPSKICILFKGIWSAN